MHLPIDISFIGPGARVRLRGEQTWLRIGGSTFWMESFEPSAARKHLELRAKIGPSLWPPLAAALEHDGSVFLLGYAPRAIRRERGKSERYVEASSYALAQWRLALAGAGLPASLYWRRIGGLALGSSPTATPVPKAEIVGEIRDAAGPAGAVQLLQAALSPLPDIETQSTELATILHQAINAHLPQVIAVPNLEQAGAVNALLFSEALGRGLSASCEAALPGAIRVIGPARLDELARALSRPPQQPTVAIALAGRRECERDLAHLATVHSMAVPRRAAWLGWLREAGMEGPLILEEIAPHLERAIEEARPLMITLFERSGAVFTHDGARVNSSWPEEWREMRQTGTAIVHPLAARLARLLRASPVGLSHSAVMAQAALAPAARVMLAAGTAETLRGAIALSPAVVVPVASAAQLRSDLQYLFERPHLCPVEGKAARAAWTLTLQLRSGDLSAWDENALRLLRELLDAREFAAAAGVLEAHALAASRSGTGPPGAEALLMARGLGLVLWPPRRQRRLFRMWLRGYAGDWRSMLLALQAQAERAFRGPQAYPALVAHALALAENCPRLAREQALVECALCVGPDDPAQARALIAQLSRRPAQDSRLLTSARALMASASAEFVSVRVAEAIELLANARECATGRGYLQRRVLGEIEALTTMCVGVLSGGQRPFDALVAPLLQLEREHGGLADQVSRATVNDQLFRLRRFESGSFEPREIESLLAEARPENVRGYMVLLNQLSENAIYRLDMGAFARLDARIQALSRTTELYAIFDAAWKRHRALMRALAGDLKGALRIWRGARAFNAPAPWNRRSAFLRHGEWGFMLLLAGKFEKASRTFFRAVNELRGMEVTGRAAHFAALGAVALLLAGNEIPARELAALRELSRGEYLFPRLLLQVIDAAQERRSWADLLAGLLGSPVVAAWRGLALALGAAVAKKQGSADAPRFAAAARKLLSAQHQAIISWLHVQFPSEHPLELELPAIAAVALAEFSFAATDPPPTTAILQRAVALAGRALGASAVFAKAADDSGRHAAIAGDERFRADLESFASRAAEAGLRGRDVVAPSALWGGMAARLDHDARPVELAVLRAFSRRLDEWLLLAAARDNALNARRREHALAQAAWSFARVPRGFNARLDQLAALIGAQTGLLGVTLSLARSARDPRAASGLSAAQEVEPGITLRIAAKAGEFAALNTALEQAARVVVEWLHETRTTPGLELFEPKPGTGATLLGAPLGNSEAAQELARKVRRYADLELIVSVVGEAGAGKDFVARALHALSRRARGEHVVVDCATLRRETAASELFGHVRGAFTGATSDHSGLLARAHHGTLQLDNIAELSQELQALLLRALEERRITPLGGQRETSFDARVIVTSQRELDDLVAQSRLRLDFAQRLGGLTLFVPPLRERSGDAVPLAEHFLAEQRRSLGRRLRFSADALKAIETHNWPGNVRELRSSVARACVLADGDEIGASQLVATRAGEKGTLVTLTREHDLKAIARTVLALARAQGALTPREASLALGISRTTASLTLSALARRDYLERVGQGRSTTYRAS